MNPARTAAASAGLLALALLGFWPHYLSRVGEFNGYTHAHAALSTLWFAMLIVQPLLLHAGRRDLHRALGRASWVLGPLMVLAAVLLAHQRVRAMDAARFAAEGLFAYLPLFSSLLFAVCWGLAMAHRRAMAVHARMMVATALTLVPPVLARVVGNFGPAGLPGDVNDLIGFVAADAALALLWWTTPAREARARRITAAVLGLFVLCHVGWFTLARSAAWLAAVAWFRSLPLT
ncbi:MAG TPA: hypothetical protein VFQ16_10725 [Burkholderiaceae bacterium]|nr:hypothetical protein [Burkholderiaceae bacterium]